jgi:putative FmdB family regulatory protein
VVYEYECPVHQRFELLRPMSESDLPGICPACRVECERIPSLTVMRPDDMWSGVMTDAYGYHTSRSSYKAELASRGHVPLPDRQAREDFDKHADSCRAENTKRLKRNMRKMWEKSLGPSGAGLGGADGQRIVDQAVAEAAADSTKRTSSKIR